MKRPRNRAVDYVAYVAVRLMVGIAQTLSIEQSYAFAEVLAKLLYRVDKRHRRVAMENLLHAFGNQYSEARRDQIVRGVYRHFCIMVMDMLHIPRKLHRRTWRRWIVLRGHERVLDLLMNGGPIVMLTGHFGNWEMAGYLFGLFGFPANAVYRPLDNPYLDAYIRAFRERTGQRLIPKKGGYEDMLDVLRSGRVLSFIADQDAGEKGMFVEFFGRPASTHKAIALLAIEHRAPVLVGYARRIGPGFRYEVGLEELIEPDELPGTPDDVRLLTQRYTSALERIIRRDPQQYLWLHRRWKHQPRRKNRNRPPGETAELVHG